MRMPPPMMALVATFLAGGLACAPAMANAQPRVPGGVIDGVVTDTALAPLASVSVTVLGTEVSVVTRENGRFRITNLPPGDYMIALRRVGYAQFVALVTMTDGDTLRPSVALERVTALSPALVTASPYDARMAEFEGRRKAGFGYFLNRDQIASLKRTFTADLFRQFSQVVDLQSGAHGANLAFNRRGGLAPDGRTPVSRCAYEVFLDGMVQPMPYDLNNLPRPVDIAGIEIYAGAATIPLQYKRLSRGSMCGIILVWTRFGP